MNLAPIHVLCNNIFAGKDVPADTQKGQLNPSDEYQYPVFTNGTGAKSLYGYSKEYAVSESAITISARGTIGYHTIRDRNFTPAIRLITLIPNKNIDIRYLNYQLSQITFHHDDGSIPQLTLPKIRNILIPTPSIDVQIYISDALDRFNQLIDGSSGSIKSEIKCRRQQYLYYLNMLF